MTSPHKVLFYATALFCFWCSTTNVCRAQEPVRIGQIVQHYTEKDGFSGTVTFAHAGAITFRRGFGYADHEHKVSFDEHTRFSVGSLSKQFTAAAILLLQQDGKLKTSDRLGQVLPAEIPQAWSEITVRQLLSHTSGLKDYAGLALRAIQTEEHLPADLLAIVRDAPLEFKPGEGFEYSNTNYVLLGMIIQKFSGMPLCAFLYRRIFDPLGMQDTQCLGETGALEHHAVGYAPVDPGDRKPLTVNPPSTPIANSLYFGAGSLVSTGDDLIRWTAALHHGRVLNEESYKEMTTPVRDGFGYGLRIGTFRGHVWIDHDGSIPGFFSELEYFPGADNIVVILSNQNALSHGAFTPGTHVIDSELMTVAVEPSAPVPSENKDVKLSPHILGLFTGKYVSEGPDKSAFTIYLKDGHLQLLQEGQGHNPSELRSDYGEMDFYLSDSDSLIEFSGQNNAIVFDLRYSRALSFHRVQP